jgi:DNA-binding HxlR family transcriptional regulator
MSNYGQYCPVAQSLELIGDRWTLLIIRDMLTGTTHFNDLERGLPGISRALLSKRLRQLESAGVIEKRLNMSGRERTEYHLTQAGSELQAVIGALLTWGAAWAFGDPSPEQLNSVLLMWWIQNRIRHNNLPSERVVVQFDFYGAETVTYWLLLLCEDVTLCLTDPGYEINVLVTADLATFFKLWLGRISYDEALREDGLQVEGLPHVVRAFPNWFAWSVAAEAVKATRLKQETQY